MEQKEATITIEDILVAMEQTWTRIERVLEHFEPVLDAGPDAGGWTPHQVLSHLTGSWQRVPIHAAFLLAGRAEVPIVFGDSFLIPEWENAPLEAFTLAMRADYEGNRLSVRDLALECGYESVMHNSEERSFSMRAKLRHRIFALLSLGGLISYSR